MITNLEIFLLICLFGSWLILLWFKNIIKKQDIAIKEYCSLHKESLKKIKIFGATLTVIKERAWKNGQLINLVSNALKDKFGIEYVDKSYLDKLDKKN